jgi:hypothetical protein
MNGRALLFKVKDGKISLERFFREYQDEFTKVKSVITMAKFNNIDTTSTEIELAKIEFEKV